MKGVLTVVAVLLLVCTMASAEIPQVLGYQGRVTENTGVPVANGTYPMRFRIYDAETGGSLLWDSGSLSVDTNAGVFAVMLGESPQPALNLAFDQDYWLLVTYRGEDQLPRKPLGSVGYAYMASGVVPGTVVSGAIPAGPQSAFRAENTSTASYTIGLWGEAVAAVGRGVLGRATATTGEAYGVLGRSYSTQGAGVYGSADATEGTTYGMYGVSASTAGRGVFGSVTATSGTVYGVYGQTVSPLGRGVYGEASSTTGSNRGVYGRSFSGDGMGVYGEATATTGSTFGVYGRSYSAYGAGLCGYATATTGTTYGVYASSYSTAGRGVYGEATATTGTTYGVYGQAASPSGYAGYFDGNARVTGDLTVDGTVSIPVPFLLTGSSTDAIIQGNNTNTIGTSPGIRGETSSTDGRAVYGYSTATSGATIGVSGSSASTDGRGVYGYATATSGITYGGYFESSSSNGRGVYGLGGPGVEGDASTTWGLGVAGRALYTTGSASGVSGLTWAPDGYGVYYTGGLAGTGTKSCVVKTSQGPTLLYCQESPENWFEDFGEGQLVNGRCHVELDPLFLETVTIDAANPMKVYVTPNGPMGEWWVEKETSRFAVVAPEGPDGATFDYRVVAKRKGFEEKRLDYCRAAETDSYLYPELREKQLQEFEERHARLRPEPPGNQAE